MQSTIYKPHYRSQLGFFATIFLISKNTWNSRFFIQQLFIRDFLATYKKSFLGVAWILVAPIASIVSWVFLQKSGMLNPGDVGVPYPAYVLVGTLMWEFFVGVFNSSTNTLNSGKNLVMQIKYPHEVLFFKELIQFFATFLLKFSIVLIVLFFFDVCPSWKTIFLPFTCLPIIFFAGSLGLITSLFSVITLDVVNITSMAFRVLIWTTPIIYSAKQTNKTVQLMNEYNPLTYLVCSTRDLILYGNLYGDTTIYLMISTLSFVFFLISWRIFYLSEQQLVEKML